MPFNANAVADELQAALQAVAIPERAEREKRYLKSDLAFLGATMPQIRDAVRAMQRMHRFDRARLVELVAALWGKPIHERRMAAVVLLERQAGLLDGGDLPFLERLIRESRTWALVDGLAANVVGVILTADPAVEETLDRWAADHDFWVRRASLLAESRRLREGGSLEAFLRRADAMLDEKEFFIRKAIGWVLRDVGKTRPAEVAAWLSPRTGRASGVTVREAVRYLPSADAERLVLAYREHRAAG